MFRFPSPYHSRFLNVLCPTVTAHFVINPEAYPKIGDTSGLKTDFLVRRLTPSAPPGTYSTKAWLAYEGKGGANTENILDQLRVYLDDWCDKKQGAACWAVGARGRQVMFWRYTGKATEKMIPLKVVVLANNTLEVKEGIEGWTFAFDFVTDMAKIQAVLQYLWYKEPTP